MGPEALSDLPENQGGFCLKVSATELDGLLAQGWRHFGPYFFQEPRTELLGQSCRVLPLRIRLDAFSPNRTQRKIWSRGKNLRVSFDLAALGAEQTKLFLKHIRRFKEHRPEQLSNFLGDHPAEVPHPIWACSLFEGERLLSVGYVDLGLEAASAIYTMWDPSESRRSLGTLTLLHELAWAKAKGLRYLYTGYYVREPSPYAYKATFSGSEFYDWHGLWAPLKPALEGSAAEVPGNET